MNSSYHNAASLALAVGIHSFKPGKNPMSSHHRLSSAFDELLHRWQGSLYKPRNRIFETREVRKGHRGMNVIGFRTPAPIWVLKNIKSRTRTICTAPLKGIACHKMQESCNKSWESKRHYRITHYLHATRIVQLRLPCSSLLYHTSLITHIETSSLQTLRLALAISWIPKWELTR